jgi:hypothetical protein
MPFPTLSAWRRLSAQNSYLAKSHKTPRYSTQKERGGKYIMNHPKYQAFYDEFHRRLSAAPDGSAFRKDCERIQDELEEEQKQTRKTIEKLIGRSPDGVLTEYSPHQVAKEMLIAKQAAFTTAMLELQQSSYNIRTFSADVVRPKALTKGLWHVLLASPFIAIDSFIWGGGAWIIAGVFLIGFIPYWMVFPIAVLIGVGRFIYGLRKVRTASGERDRTQR